MIVAMRQAILRMKARILQAKSNLTLPVKVTTTTTQHRKSPKFWGDWIKGLPSLKIAA